MKHPTKHQQTPETLAPEEIEELLSKISDKAPEAPDSFWEELLEDVNDLLEED